MATVAVVGGGSLQGREILSQLESRKDVDQIVLLSEKAGGTEIPFRGTDLIVEDLDQDALEEKPDVVVFATGAARADRWARRFAEAGSRVVDLSSAHRLDLDVPLAGLTATSGSAKTSKLVAVPSAGALAAARMLAPLFGQGAAGSARLSATLLVPVSNAGQAGVRELSRQTAALLRGRSASPRRFSHRIAFNALPEAGKPGASGADDTSLERSFRAEVRRLLSLPGLPISVTAVRVPIFFGLSMVLAGSNGDPHSPAVLAKAFARPRAGIKVLDGSGAFPMPLLTVGDSNILVGRIRSDEDGGFQLFAAVDALELVAECAISAALGAAR